MMIPYAGLSGTAATDKLSRQANLTRVSLSLSLSLITVTITQYHIIRVSLKRSLEPEVSARGGIARPMFSARHHRVLIA